MQIKIKSLELTNFKGLAELKVNFANLTNILGPNGSGKTTIVDSFTWLMFDKDSQGRSTFDIKTIGLDGEVIHNLEHSVNGVIEVSGKVIKLEKVYKEKWTKTRGKADAEFTGHTTTYFIDETPVKKNEYIQRVSEIIDEDLFKLITNPNHFASLSWADKRTIVMQLITFDDAVVYDSDKSLQKLKDLVGDKSFNDFKKTLASKRKTMNDELKLIPARINEVHSMIVEKDFEKSKTDLKAIEKEIKSLDSKITGATSYDTKGADKQSKYFKLLGELRSKKSALSNDHDTKVDTFKREISLRESRINSAKNNIDNHKHTIDSLTKDIESHEESKAVLLKNWHEIKSAEFVLDPKEKICPTCSQDLLNFDPTSLRENFEKSKKEQLGKIQVSGTKSRKIMDTSAERIDEYIEELKEFSKTIEENTIELQRFQKELEEESKFLPLEDIEYKSLEKEVNSLEKYKVLEKIEDPDLIGWEKIKKELSVAKDEINKILGQESQNVKNKERITELEDKQKHLSTEIAALEGQVFLAESFIQTKMNMVEQQINNKFNMVNFKLFDVQINGGIKESCEPIVDGVPYSALNTAAQVNSGLDIINTLSKHYGFNAPIWVDNRESINDLIEVEAQVINLYVSETGTKLEIQEVN